MSSIRNLVAVVILAVGGAATAAPPGENRNVGPHPEEYVKMFRGQTEGLDHNNVWFWYHAGMIAALKETSAHYTELGQNPLFCLSRQYWPTELRDLILHELAKDGSPWRRVSSATVETVALQALRQKYPC